MKYAFENLEVWQKSRHLVKSVYLLASSFPEEEKFGLTSQMRRQASLSAAILLKEAPAGVERIRHDFTK